jgi:hypothetical protein
MGGAAGGSSDRALVEAAVAELRALGVDDSVAAPGPFRALWERGWLVPPPHFLGLPRLVGVLGGAFALVAFPVFAVLCSAILWLGEAGSLLDGVVVAFWASLACGALFGLVLGAWYRYDGRVRGVPSWESWVPAARAEEQRTS